MFCSTCIIHALDVIILSNQVVQYIWQNLMDWGNPVRHLSQGWQSPQSNHLLWQATLDFCIKPWPSPQSLDRIPKMPVFYTHTHFPIHSIKHRIFYIILGTSCDIKRPSYIVGSFSASDEARLVWIHQFCYNGLYTDLLPKYWSAIFDHYTAG